MFGPNVLSKPANMSCGEFTLECSSQPCRGFGQEAAEPKVGSAPPPVEGKEELLEKLEARRRSKRTERSPLRRRRPRLPTRGSLAAAGSGPGRSPPRGHARDVHILSCGFLLIFSAYGATQNLESTVNTVSTESRCLAIPLVYVRGNLVNNCCPSFHCCFLAVPEDLIATTVAIAPTPSPLPGRYPCSHQATLDASYSSGCIPWPCSPLHTIPSP
ncbi:hypothetical protein NL676_007747 [Syzygium grande]|nr:hypothetical protein NL676_007747 [Syzygium grande]